MKPDAPGHAPRVDLQLLLELALLPVHQQHHRLVGAGKRVGDFGQSGHGQVLAVGTESHVAGTTHVRSELLVETPHELCFPLPGGLARGNVPLLDHPHQVKRRQTLAVGMEDHGVGIPLVALEDVHQFPGPRVPELQQVVVATRGQQRSVGTGSHPADPTLVSDQHPFGGRFGVGQRPDADAVVVTAGIQPAAIGRKIKRADPAVVPVQDGASRLGAGQWPAIDLEVLGRRHHKTPGRVNPTCGQRYVVDAERADDVRLGHVDARRQVAGPRRDRGVLWLLR